MFTFQMSRPGKDFKAVLISPSCTKGEARVDVAGNKFNHLDLIPLHMPQRYDSRSGDHADHQFPSEPFTSMSVFILEVDTGTNNILCEWVAFSILSTLSESVKVHAITEKSKEGRDWALLCDVWAHWPGYMCCCCVSTSHRWALLSVMFLAWSPLAELQACTPMITPTASKHLCMGEAWLGPTDSPHSLCNCVCLCERSVRSVCFVFSGTRVEIFQMKVHVCVWLYVYVCLSIRSSEPCGI